MSELAFDLTEKKVLNICKICNEPDGFCDHDVPDPLEEMITLSNDCAEYELTHNCNGCDPEKCTCHDCQYFVNHPDYNKDVDENGNVI